MALMDMPEVAPLFSGLTHALKPGGSFVFSVTHPCFHSEEIQRFTEMYEEEAGRHIIRTGVKVSSYLTCFSKKTEGIIGPLNPQWYFHRPIQELLRTDWKTLGFLSRRNGRRASGWDDMPEIPPVMVVRMRLNE